jgi:quercetin dioxygenase-like cupin family protein
MITTKEIVMKTKNNKKETSSSSLKAKVLNPAGLVDYAAGSIVSKTLIDRKTGTLTLFAFDCGQGLSEHVAPFDAVVEILDGEALITIAGKELKAKSGAFVIMPANVPHALKAARRFKMLLIMIRGK